ncbi:hypothetical protein B0T16DRAFT_100723 [Cercophora newfieldiana]|uniref:Uncharacterized protein n=1 Tax=Cercophora newfieldiana TaxID=92897 RepID=A0AA40CX29_9PEZI|nr:hypothetical protein B0T16DRAFT_100723 [Cercophora newfieldiana]
MSETNYTWHSFQGAFQPWTLVPIILFVAILCGNCLLALCITRNGKPRRATDDFDERWAFEQYGHKGRHKKKGARMQVNTGADLGPYSRDVNGLQSPIGLQFPVDVESRGGPVDDGFEMAELRGSSERGRVVRRSV